MFLELLKKRRSIRKYQDRHLDPETIDLLVEAALRAPTSMGKNSCTYQGGYSAAFWIRRFGLQLPVTSFFL